MFLKTYQPELINTAIVVVIFIIIRIIGKIVIRKIGQKALSTMQELNLFQDITPLLYF